jgi:lipopolysaccharide/colanic/teichoic acid biosynthesis glycosyltransferase
VTVKMAAEETQADRPLVLPAETPRASDIAMRLLDVAGAAFALLIRLDSPGPAIFRQRRVGRNLEPFAVAKFRTMRHRVPADRHRDHVEQMIREDDDAKGKPRPMKKLQRDPRITKVGGFLRRTSLDELPQLWNVLRGEMSLVGPRPPIQYEVDAYPARAFRRFAVRPGLTGLWQVSGRSLVTFSEMIDLDIEYVERRSLLLNLKIVVLTVPTVIHGKGAQ